MAGFRDFLTRFRPVGTPGPAVPGGVPADRTAQITAELEPVFASLEATETEARLVRARAAEEAARIRGEAERSARAAVARARRDAAGIRAESARRALARAESEAASLLAAADRDVVRVRRRAAARMPALVEDAFGLARAELSAGNGPRPESGPGSGR
ncbi:hypothetical protein I3F58_08855 [Streptomyces sp. MUM 203J]|uniref:hypothetical protein n=1 Tax=Streptomyces sp. MUM 203J TaxID=2791990 RepID=UPI001F04BD36|nr:hypothetical protein [Streptomyces sp. MUM 203J]MCH0539674.1 hypothetical protein [Streptomyces sp. MUM 203J]